MKPERWHLIDQILDGALEREGNQRKAFLEEACSGDVSLRKEVESLIQADERVKSFIESPALEQTARTVAQTRVQSSLAGQEIGFYKILSLLGRGGMGEVYLAQDTNLHRKVALKFLTEQFTQDDERLAQFRREARLLASLNHASIAAIHGLEESGGVRFLVLELVEGETLAQRLSRGPLPVEEALAVSRQIAEGLEAAHESGVIHRDLKPANVKITPDGTVKILDFGLAKAAETGGSEAANSRSLTMEATREGIVLGTAAYMSPEQARGQAVDKRTDIWSFGLLLFEMLTGKGMYADKSLTETIAAVIHQEPNLEQLPEDTPQKIRDLLERCLRKDSRMRLRDMGDARITIDEYLRGEGTPEERLVPLTAPPAWRSLVPWAVVPILVILAGAFRPDAPLTEKPVSRWQIPLEQGQVLGSFRRGVAFSPDGTLLAFVSAADASFSSPRKIHVRSLDGWTTVPLELGGYGVQPFFSPDGKWLGFHGSADYEKGGEVWKLKKVPLDGGPATTICDCRESYGASWGSDDTIVFACSGGARVLWRVSAAGGEPEPITELDEEAHEINHRLPHLLPGAKAVLFTVMRYHNWAWDRAQIAVQSLETGERRVLVESGVDGRYVPTGHLVFVREATLMAAPFDLASLKLRGDPVPVLEGVTQSIHAGNSRLNTAAAQFAFSGTGSLAYVAGSVFPESKAKVVRVDRDGKVKPTNLDRASYSFVRFSPDNSEALVNTLYKKAKILSYDFDRGTSTLETLEGSGSHPLWSLDGKGFVFSSDRDGSPNLYWKSVQSDGEIERLTVSPYADHAVSWNQDGSKLAFLRLGEKKSAGIWILQMKGNRSAERFPAGGDFKEHPEFSPDGRWLAYVSDETGSREVYVAPYAGPGRRERISTNGGTSPAWTKGGKELVYWDGRKMWAVEIAPQGSDLNPGKPFALFTGRYQIVNPVRGYDVTRDGQRFLMVLSEPSEGGYENRKEFFGNRVDIVVNWFEELERLVPTD